MGWVVIAGIVLVIIVIQIGKREARNKIYNLVILRLELENLRTTHRMDDERYEKLLKPLHEALVRSLEENVVKPGTLEWIKRKQNGWNLLEEFIGHSLYPEPWKVAPVEPSETKPFDQPLPLPETPPPIPKAVPQPTAVPSAVPRVPKTLKPEKVSIPKEVKIPVGSKAPKTPADQDFAWKPSRPGALEQALQKASSISRLIAPFLVQNIGWFISGFSFVAGSVFLITYTAGFTRSLIIGSSLFSYTLLLMLGAYHLLRKRPELRPVSSVLLTTGMLLIPLSIASSVRLFNALDSFGFQFTAAGVLVAANIGVFYYVAQIASGIMDRSLQHLHPRLFMALAGMQITVPVMSKIPLWYLTAGVHLTILGLWVYSMNRFIHDWIKALFIERRKIACYAAGTLTYAAAVSFVHLIWQYPGNLPDGYAGPFLMLLCGVLFYADSKFKQWTHSYAFLSRLTFVVYGVSVLAVALCYHADMARMLTLMLGIGVYGAVLWHYLTLPPLYLLIGCAAWLYGLLVLKHIPSELYVAASMPGLCGLIGMHRWALNRKSPKLATTLFRMFMLLSIGLMIRSFWNAEPGWSATVNGLLAFGLMEIIRHYEFGMNKQPHLAIIDSLFVILQSYAAPLIVSVTAAYFPVIPYVFRIEQLGIVLSLLAVFWTWRGIKTWKSSMMNQPEQSIPNSQFLIPNLNVLAVFILIGVSKAAYPSTSIPSMVICAFVLLWQSLTVFNQRLFYGALIAAAVAGAWFKRIYFPGPSVALAEMLTAFGIWGMLQRIRHHAFVNCFSTPLVQAMMLLWGFALFKIGAFLFIRDPSPAWVVNAGLGTIMTARILIRFNLLWLMPVPIVMGLITVLSLTHQFTAIHTLTFSLVAAGYACGVRFAGETFKQLLNFSNFFTSYLILLAGMVSAGWYWLDTPNCYVLLTLAMALLFFLSAFRIQNSSFFSSHVLAMIALMASVVHVEMLGILDPAELILDPRTGILLNILMFGAGIAYYGIQHAAMPIQQFYNQPLQVTAILLSFVCGIQQGMLIADGTDSLIVIIHLMLAGAGLLIIAHSIALHFFKVVGFVMLIVGILCTETVIFHRGMPFIYGYQWEDWWVCLSVLSWVMSYLSFVMNSDARYRTTLWIAAVISFVPAVVKAAAIFVIRIAELETITLLYPAIFIILSWELFPLLYGVAFGSALRSIGLALLSSMMVLAAVPVSHPKFGHIMVAWSYGLWIMTNWVLPLFNRRFPAWEIAPESWYRLGFLLLCIHVVFITPNAPAFLQWENWLCLSGYLFLILRNSPETALPWIAVGSLTLTGVLAIFTHYGQPDLIALLIWANLLLAMTPLWRRYGHSLTAALSLKPHDLSIPFFFFSSLIVGIHLTIGIVSETLLLVPAMLPLISKSLAVKLSLLLSLSYLHLLYLSRNSREAHGLLMSLCCLVMTIPILYPDGFFGISILLALWTCGLLAACLLLPSTFHPLPSVLCSWLTVFPWITLTALTVLPVKSLGETLSVLSAMMVVFGMMGWKRRDSWLTLTGEVLFLIVLHTWLTAFVPSKAVEGLRLWQVVRLIAAKFDQIKMLLPWYSVQVLAAAWIISKMADRHPKLTEVLNHQLASVCRFMTRLAVVEWLIHAVCLAQSVPFHGNPVYGSAGMLTPIVLIIAGIRRLIRTNNPEWVYKTVGMISACGVYLRFWCLGWDPPNLWDTGWLLGISYALFITGRLMSSSQVSEAIFKITVILPLFALLTVPWQLASPDTAVVLLLIGALYLSLYHTSKKAVLLLSAILMLNLSVYLWIPLWAGRYDLIQLYVIPASLSVLLLAHLHRKELKRSVLNSTRLASICALYACATADVFLRPELWVFILILWLSLIGIIGGIALRIRAFLYGGVVFMVVNVIAQIIRFYPEHRLGKGIALMILGAVIMTGMIGFNLKKEEILKQIRIFRADLEDWE